MHLKFSCEFRWQDHFSTFLQNYLHLLKFHEDVYLHEIFAWISWGCISSWNSSKYNVILISNFRRVLNVVCFLLGDSRASEIYMPTFRNNLSVPSSINIALRLVHSTRTYLPMKMEQSVPKRRHINFRRRGITQKKAYNKYNVFQNS